MVRGVTFAGSVLCATLILLYSPPFLQAIYPAGPRSQALRCDSGDIGAAGQPGHVPACAALAAEARQGVRAVPDGGDPAAEARHGQGDRRK